jgi:hypothetical protein
MKKAHKFGMALLLTALLMFSGSNAEAAKIRAFHIPLGGIEYKEYLLSTIDKLAGKFNILIIEVDNKVKYDSEYIVRKILRPAHSFQNSPFW